MPREGPPGIESATRSLRWPRLPNNELGDMMGVGFQHVGDVHVDARGAHDQAAIEAAAHRGYKRAVSDSMMGSANAQREQSRRVPGMVKRG